MSAHPARAFVNPDEAGGNVYDKYASRKPIERQLVARFMRTLDGLVARSGAREAHEVGCGEGEVAVRLAGLGLDVRGTDAFDHAIEDARALASAAGAAASFDTKPVQTLTPPGDAAELVVCCEVLEHLEDPAGALDVLAGLARPWLIASVPREPLWRVLNVARGSYLGSLGNTPGHLHHWSKPGFTRFLETRFELVEVRSPLPWTMALCRAR